VRAEGDGKIDDAGILHVTYALFTPAPPGYSGLELETRLQQCIACT